MHGFNVVVIDAREHYARVQFNNGSTQCYDIPNRNLLVRHSEYYFINDGRIDHDAARKHHDKIRSSYNDRNVVDTEDECRYDDWDREDMIDKIKELENKIESMDYRIHNL